MPQLGKRVSSSLAAGCSRLALWEAQRVATFASYICLQPLGGARELFPENARDLLEFAIVD